ncbi:purple acid phosphatase 15-like isoform X3 [Vigna umbellata]|uniref:purple acid phosphatase 15-like isoform X3 n=1 Tax=Vigna umbellata TaxID=87088 RepID=UPI001F5E6922|nr:purple acid phosphatase 15-like isoform X3 [Vigna umbellata]
MMTMKFPSQALWMDPSSLSPFLLIRPSEETPWICHTPILCFKQPLKASNHSRYLSPSPLLITLFTFLGLQVPLPKEFISIHLSLFLFFSFLPPRDPFTFISINQCLFFCYTNHTHSLPPHLFPHSIINKTLFSGEFQIGDNIEPLDPNSVASVVRYGRFRRSTSHRAKGYSHVYSQLYPFEGLQNYTSGIIHHVRLTGLRPNTLYQYECGDPSLSAMSDVHYFRTMPVSGPKSYPNRIAVVGDLGLTYNTTSTFDHITSNHPDLILLVGDVTYADLYLTNGTGAGCYSCAFPDTPIHETYQPRWDYWGRYMQPLISSVPIMVIEGDHDIEPQAGNQTFVAYSSRFAFPSEESGSSSTLYYSFKAGGIHFIMLGSYTSHDKSGDQYKWLERDLASVDREVTPWLVATWHAPWYSTYKAHYREAECMRVEMEDLLYKYGVDIVFNGHVNAYKRTNRVYNYTLDPCGPVYITVGDGGNREKMATTHADEPGECPEPSTTPDDFLGGFCAFNFTSGPAAGNFCWDRQPDYSAFRESSFGHGILEVKNETHALWIWHRNQDFYDSAGDEIYIVRQPQNCPPFKPAT